jgi:DNA-binding MarR family transcriptional regulator
MEFDRPIEQLVYETTALHHRMKIVIQHLHGGGELAAGKRGILKGIEIRGPQTVPQMARARPVSRQHIRASLEPLLAEGLVQYVHNPNHKRSKLVDLTPKGAARLQAINRRENQLFDSLQKQFGGKGVREAAALLRRLRDFLAREELTAKTAKPRRGRKKSM